MSATTNKLRSVLDEALGVMGWNIECIHRLRPMYTKPSLITPALVARIVADRRGNYKIDGAVTIIHREFEKRWWIQGGMLKASKLKFDYNALCLHISNVRLLSASSYLGTGLNSENVVAFADAWAGFSASLPQNDDALRDVFLAGFLAGIDLDT